MIARNGRSALALADTLCSLRPKSQTEACHRRADPHDARTMKTLILSAAALPTALLGALAGASLGGGPDQAIQTAVLTGTSNLPIDAEQEWKKIEKLEMEADSFFEKKPGVIALKTQLEHLSKQRADNHGNEIQNTWMAEAERLSKNFKEFENRLTSDIEKLKEKLAASQKEFENAAQNDNLTIKKEALTKENTARKAAKTELEGIIDRFNQEKEILQREADSLLKGEN